MNRKKRIIALLGIAAASVLILSAPGQAEGLKLGFKLTGGINYQFLGDGDAYLRGLKERTDDFIASTGYSLDQSVTPLVAHLGLEFDADAILYLTPQFGISIGTGLIRNGTLFGSGTQIIGHSSTTETDANTVSATAVPVKLGIYYAFHSIFVPTGKSSFYLFCGIGFYSAQFAMTENWSTDTLYSNYTETSKSNGIGFHGGFGSENWITPNFAFVFEIFGRYVNIGGFKGDWQSNDGTTTSSGSGSLYYFEWLDSNTGKWYPSTMIAAVAPSGSSVRSVREAKIDFSGLGLRFGIKINF
jgi:hypothetical protein